MIVDRPARVVPAVRTSTGERRSAAASPRPVFGTVLALLPMAALLELLLVRTFYRVGIFIPKRGPFRTIYAALTEIGSFAFNLSSVLAFLAIGSFVVRAFRSGRNATGIVLGAFGLAALLAAMPGAGGAGPAVRPVFALSAVFVAWPFVRAPGPVGHRAAVAAVVLAVLSSAYAGIGGDATRLLDGGLSGTVSAQLAGEALAVLAAFLFFCAAASERGVRTSALLLGALPALALLIAWRANGAILGILVLWTAGFRLYLPIWLYAIAMWAFCASAVAWFGSRSSRSGGMVLLLVAGFLLDSTYVQVLMLLALLLLTDGRAVGGIELAERRAG